MNYVYIIAGSKLGTVILKLACEGPFYRTWSRSNVYCMICASMMPNLLIFLGLVFIYLLRSCYVQDTWVMLYGGQCTEYKRSALTFVLFVLTW